MVKAITSKEKWATMKPDKEVYEEFQALSISTDDGIKLVTVSQKLKYLVNLYKNINRL